MADAATQLTIDEELNSQQNALSLSLTSVELQLEFASETTTRDYVTALTSLFYNIAQTCVFIDEIGRSRDDLDFGEIAQRIKVKPNFTTYFFLPFEQESQKISIILKPENSKLVSIQAQITLEQVTTNILWCQANPEFLGPLPILGLPIQNNSFSINTLHPLVALGIKIGSFLQASLYISDEPQPRYKWNITPEAEGFAPIVSSMGETIWSVSDGKPSSNPIAWCFGLPSLPEPVSLTAEWWSRFDDLVRAAPTNATELENHLCTLLPRTIQWRFGDITLVQHAEFMVPVEDGLVMALIPSANEVLVAVDLHLPANSLQTSLLHAIAHLALRHVRPGDKWGHWDTSKITTASEPHRQWDREAKDYIAKYLQRPTKRRVNSLEECTPTEKAQLGLWRMIGEMLGESRRLNSVAERYQKAAYQRQAAQRMVAMLEDYAGAMLCDGVGLGKTYVATTLIVHYANNWREHWASTPEKLLEDPFRITILAPNSVVSTWRREALPSLVTFGVSLPTVRVISHTKLSRMSRTSQLLELSKDGTSDLEHLLLSDLVIVDEAHNFRSLAARRTKVLRDLLRLQPRRELRRKVALLTATPVNNSLDDLRQELSLLFSRPLWLSDAKTDDGYRRQAVKEIQDRCVKARKTRSRADVANIVIHGNSEAKFSDTMEFRDDLDFGHNVQRIGDYLKEQDKRLKELQDQIRITAQNNTSYTEPKSQTRIAEDLLDRIIVQRSRVLCKEIERQQASNVELLFRPDAEVPEKLYYSDEYDGIEDVLARFIPLFDGDSENYGRSKTPSLSLKIYMWYDVREGIKKATEFSSVVGLQRVLVLKRLESSPVSFLITLLRLTVLHAHRLQQLENLCISTGDSRYSQLQAEIKAILTQQETSALEKIRLLATGEPHTSHNDFIQNLSRAYNNTQSVADTADQPLQLLLFSDETESSPQREQLDRLWTLREAIITDFKTLLSVTPELADIIFGKFEKTEWPHRFIAGGEAIDWPKSAAWGLRLVTDAKLRQLVSRLILARRANQKVIVFSQFSDTIAYVQSVLKACDKFSRNDWTMTARGLGVANLHNQELIDLVKVTEAVTGETEDRDEVVNAFAPFYRIGPWRPVANDNLKSDNSLLVDNWETSWAGAMERPIDILLSSDVLAEGVNLQDAALLINFDVHWNPVRMIQRAGRIDRRLNPRIEKPQEFPDLAALAARRDKPVPSYYWHNHPDQAPVTVNMILPDELEAELQLRERIATKTMAIDFTLGLEQGTGAEADWMESYKYHGITSLNSFQKDRAIEQVASHHEKLSRKFTKLGIRSDWAENLNGWFREKDADSGAPLVGRSKHGRRGGEQTVYTRYLEPTVIDGSPYWLWSQTKPSQSLLNFWLCLDSKTFPPLTRNDLLWHENASVPITANYLLAAMQQLELASLEELAPQNVGRPLMQGITAISAGFLATEADRRSIQIGEFFLLQLKSFEIVEQSMRNVDKKSVQRRGLSRACPICGHVPDMHKCCPRCKVLANGELEVENKFGFRVMSDSNGVPYEVPQPWCRACRHNALGRLQERENN